MQTCAARFFSKPSFVGFVPRRNPIPSLPAVTPAFLPDLGVNGNLNKFQKKKAMLFKVINRNDLKPDSEGLQPKSDGLQPNCNGLQPNSDGLQPTSDGLQPKSDGLQPKSDGLEPKSDDLQPDCDVCNLRAMASNLIAMATNPRAKLEGTCKCPRGQTMSGILVAVAASCSMLSMLLNET